MLKFIQANLDPPDGKLGEAIELAWKQHVPARGSSFAMGLGWHIARDGSTRWHNGQTAGYHSMLMISRPGGFGVVVLCNTASMEVDALTESIVRLMAGMEVKPREFKRAVVKQVDPDVMKRLAGRYELVPGFVLTVTIRDDKLYVQATNQAALRVFPESDTRWNYRAVKASLTFDLPEAGNCKAVTLHQNGRTLTGQRLTD